MINIDTKVVTPANLFSEIELTDEQLESICGGFDHGDHDDHHDRNDRDDHRHWRRGDWDRWHHWY